MRNFKQIVAGLFLVTISLSMASAQSVTPPVEKLEAYTADWEGERYESGRPKVSLEILERLKDISIEAAWGVLNSKGYHNQFAGDWKMIHENRPFTGRALTALYYPKRPDVRKRMMEQGHEEGHVKNMNSWPIDMLHEGDVYVADCFGKTVDGTLIGDNLGNAIYAKSKRGVVFDGGLRDLEGLQEIEGFNAYVRGWNPTYLKETMLMGINVPIKIGKAVVFPGDVVLAKEEGVLFIPAHLAKEVTLTAEFVKLRDKFGHAMLKKGEYTAGEIDSKWSEEIKQHFLRWIEENPDLVPMSQEELDNYMENRTW
jgi:regulator of RNase E activity RraA